MNNGINMQENKRKVVQIGTLRIGNGLPVRVQSMTNTDTHDYEATLKQVQSLDKAGCEIIRLAVPDMEAVETIRQLKNEKIAAPLVADIHFDYKIAVACCEAGVDKIRINPGNIGSRQRVREVVAACRERKIPIRIGVNGGSLEKEILHKYGSPTAEALAESALGHVRILEEEGFDDIVISIKSSDVRTCIAANRLLYKMTAYPLHIGVTEAGSVTMGRLRSAVGIGSLLCDGIGDTIRVSLTADPLLEVTEGKNLLHALGLDQSGISIVSCPTCGRTKIELIELVERFENEYLPKLNPSRSLKVALMGCAVNGPGEAREADIGIAGGIGEALLFKKGQIVGKYPEEKILDILTNEINQM
ncbi:MAG: flavodoxin-dependent (E)-4-hydroxy-3-methylbut-2-enyl-diphosphate synthase [Clostridia bacterium]|nr:flavodoxin-dependent (E)-4-hydroxy-3-methylbut-2-enyl-diphosphate synthase [Clostridia bacterium]